MLMLKRGRQLCTLEALRACSNLTSDVLNLQRMRELMSVLPGMLVPRWVEVDPAGGQKARMELMWELLEQAEGHDPVPVTVHTCGKFSSMFREALLTKKDNPDVEPAVLPQKPTQAVDLTPMEKIQLGASKAPSQISNALASSVSQRNTINAAPELGKCTQISAPVKHKALSELDPALVEKARELARHHQADVQAGHQHAMRAVSKLSRLSTISPVVRTLFRSKKKKALPFVDVVRHVAQAERVNSTAVEVKELLKKMVELVPHWCGLKTYPSSGEFFTLDREADFEAVQRQLKNAELAS